MKHKKTVMGCLFVAVGALFFVQARPPHRGGHHPRPPHERGHHGPPHHHMISQEKHKEFMGACDGQCNAKTGDEFRTCHRACMMEKVCPERCKGKPANCIDECKKRSERHREGHRRPPHHGRHGRHGRGH